MYRRNLDGRTLTLGASGWTWRDTFVLVDHETLSLWWGGAGPVADSTLRCVAGELQGAELPQGTAHRAIWSSQVAVRPDTRLALLRSQR